jgi:hypothetical protein
VSMMMTTPLVQSIAVLETVNLIATLPMTKLDFIAKENVFKKAIALTAGVNVNAVVINEVVESAKRRHTESPTSRRILGAVVKIGVSVTGFAGITAALQNQNSLNENMNVLGLPACTLQIQYPGLTTFMILKDLS